MQVQTGLTMAVSLPKSVLWAVMKLFYAGRP
jgi:hypothetical protein